ncbi:MAG: GNAT family N-acetyltransferase [Bosea sp. (in: a-proteobacteria)]
MEDADRETVIDLIWQLNLFEDKISADRAPGRKAAAGGLGANRRRMSEHGGTELVAEIDGKIIGYLLCVIEKAEAYIRDSYGMHAYIAELVIAEGHRGQGLGSKLIAAAEDFARGRGMPSIFIGVLAGNNPADRLYQHLGYDTYNIERIKRLD